MRAKQAARSELEAIAARRMASQQIARPRLANAEAVVSWMGAVQAQDYNAARWAVGLRMAGAGRTDAEVEAAIDEGRILRTHVMRWTWQLVAPADLRWLLSLVGARLRTRVTARHRQLELDAGSFRRSRRALERALRDGRHRTRGELAVVLEKAGVSPAGQRLSHLLAHAELEALICSGARRGKQATHALVEHRTPADVRSFDRRDALAELAGRYFQSRGPASVEDFSWWSGLTKAEARQGVEAIERSLVREEVAGKTYWQWTTRGRVLGLPLATLLPAFDEYLVAYRDRSAVLDPADTTLVNAGGGMLGPCLLLRGRVVGRWRRTVARDAVAIEVAPLAAPREAERRAITAAAERYAAFLGLRAEIKVGGSTRGPARDVSPPRSQP